MKSIRAPLALLVGAGFALALVGAPARAAGFVNDRAGWKALSPDARNAYIQGLNDSLNFAFVDDTMVNALAKAGRTRCLMERKINAAALAEGIDSYYRQDQYAALPPAALYILRMQEVCRFYINQKRAEFGLGPM